MQIPELNWIDAANNPWGVRVLDVRPVTLTMLSTSKDPQMAANAVSYGSDDGTGFIGVEPPLQRAVSANLVYRIDKVLADGALFLPNVMEHKWALYYHGQKIIFIRGWLRQVKVVADVNISSDQAEIVAVHGAFLEDEAPALTLKILDYLLRSHALGITFPAPLPPDVAQNPQQAAMWCMSVFGKLAPVATPEDIPFSTPEKPLRTYSLLHIAVARGDSDRAAKLLESGVPVELLDRNGLTPLHWVLGGDDTNLADLLIERGSSVDVRSGEGATPLMNAVQSHKEMWINYLIDHGADVNATDARGFTALHRAAEMGDKAAVQLLLARGAQPHPEAQGHTPLSLAQQRGENEIVDILEKH